MNIRTSAFRSFATLSLLALGLTACDEKDVIIPVETPPVTVTVTPTQLNLEQGQTGSVVAIVSNSTNTAVTWGTSNAAVATVSAAGVVTAVAPGNAVITATSAADANAKAAANVTVTPRPVPVINVSLLPSTATIDVGGTVGMSGSVSGTGITNFNVTYRSSAPSVATVSATGIVTGVAPGQTVITAISAQDTTRRASSVVTVNALPPIVVAISPTNATTPVGGTVQFVNTITGTTNTNVTYRSANPAVATVTNGGLATGVAAGATTITVISNADTTKRASATLTVTAVAPPPPVTVSIAPQNPSAQAGNLVQFTASVGNASNTTVLWTSSNGAVATIDANGVATTIAAGQTVITATSQQDPTKNASTILTVTAAPPPPPVVVSVTPSAASAVAGGTIQLVPTVSGTTNTAVTYTSSAPGVATVDANGMVTTLAAGTAVITVTSQADPTKTAQSVITVTAPPAVTISISPSTASGTVGQTINFVATVSGSANTAATFSSSDETVVVVNATTGVANLVGAGTAVIRATSVVDPTKVATATVTVVAQPPVVISVAPTTVSNLGVGAQTQVLATITGTNNQDVLCTSANTAIATVATTADNRGCIITGAGAGNTVITVASAADPTKIQNVPVSVVGASVAIATTSAAVPPATTAGAFTVSANVSVPAGTADSLVLRLTNTTTGQQYNVFCQQFTSAGAATTVICPINPADYDARMAGTQVLPNATYSVQAFLYRADQVAATATFGQQIITNNPNTVAGVVTFSNGLNDVDNNPDAEQDVDAAGNVWFGGSITVDLTSSVFQGNAINTIEVVADLNCNGVDDGAGEPSKVVTFTGQTAQAVFSEASTIASAAQGVDDLVDPSVCFTLINPRDASNAAVNLPAFGGGTGNVVTGPTAAAPAPAGSNTAVTTPGISTQNTFAIDNVPPVFPGGFMFDAADFDGLTTNVYLSGNTVLRTDATSGSAAGGATILGGQATTEAAGTGVDRQQTVIYAVPVASFNAGNLSGSAAAGTAFVTCTGATTGTCSGTAASLAESFSAGSYVMVAESFDALGNVVYAQGPNFGVDLTAPTIALVADGDATPDAVNGGVNPADVTIRFAVTDANSGAEGLQGAIRGYSVFEVDADNTTEVRCYTFAGAFASNESGFPAGNAACGVQRTTGPVATAGGTEFYEVTIPADENFYAITLNSFDAAGNVSSTTFTFNTLVDVTAGPDAATGLNAVTVNNYTIDNLANTATVNGVVRDNIEVRDYDARFRFPGLTSPNAIDVPDEVPFSTPTTVGTYGLPLTAEQTVNAQSGSIVDAIATATTQAAVADPAYDPDMFGFGMKDLASNYTFGGINFTPGAYNGFGAEFTCAAAVIGGVNYPACGFDLASSHGTIDRTSTSAATPQVATLTASITTTTGAAQPLQTIYFYYVDPGIVAGYQGAGVDPTEHNVLIAMMPASAAPTFTTEQRRVFTSTASLDATTLPAATAGTGFRVFAIGVAADGDAIMSTVQTVNVNN